VHTGGAEEEGAGGDDKKAGGPAGYVPPHLRGRDGGYASVHRN
jgi:hypothetical protein